MAQSDSLTAKLDELTAEAEELVRDFQDAHYKYTSKIRTRLVVLVLQMIPVELQTQRRDSPELQEKFNSIVLLLEKKMRAKYPKLKESLSNLLQRFLGPTLVPFAMMQAPTQDQIQQALLTTYEATSTTPSFPRNVNFLPTSNRITDNAEGAAVQPFQPPTSLGGRVPPPAFRSIYLPVAPQRPYQPTQQQLNYLPISSRYPPQEYEANGQYYWPTNYRQRVQYPYQDIQMQPSSQWYWSQPAQMQWQPSQRQNYWNYPYQK